MKFGVFLPISGRASGPETLMEAARSADVLGFEGGIGARSEVVDGKFTGRDADVFTYREGKAEAIRQAAAQVFDFPVSASSAEVAASRALSASLALNRMQPLIELLPNVRPSSTPSETCSSRSGRPTRSARWKAARRHRA